MRCVRSVDAKAFADRVEPWLERDPYLNNVVSTVVRSRTDPMVPVDPATLLVAVEADGGDLVGVAIRTPPRSLLLSAMPIAAAETLAAWLVAEGLRVPGVDGPGEVGDAFAQAYGRYAYGKTVRAGMGRRLFRLDRVEWPTGVDGTARPAELADRELLRAWADAFALDTGTGAGGGELTLAIDLRLRRTDVHLLWLWMVEETPVSMVWLNDPVAGVRRVSGVYTPPEHRGHGYASACVAHTSQYALDTGSPACMLYTDLANPTSNKIYQQIGYRPISDAREWIFTDSAEPTVGQAR